MPALSPTMSSGNVGRWKKAIGDSIKPGDILVEIETDKATMDFEVQEEGFLAAMLVPEGTKEVAVNKPLAVIVPKKEYVGQFVDFKLSDSSSGSSGSPASASSVSNDSGSPVSQPQPVKTSPSQVPTTTSNDTSRIKASPLAKNIAASNNINLSNISQGTGPNGRIVKSDVLSFLSSAPKAASAASSSIASAVAASQFSDIPLTNMRKVIASRLLESKQTIPHYYLTIQIKMSNILSLRSKFNSKLSDSGIKLSVNDFLIKAASLALMKHPEVNSSWQGDFIRQFNSADINVAVSTPTGLITPIVFSAQSLGLASISREVKSLANRAKEGKLLPNEYQGGTFTISNLGMFGISHFTAIINPPQSAILAVGSVQPENNQMSVTLSCDHRVIDGAKGAEWLQTFKGYCEDPESMLL